MNHHSTCTCLACVGYRLRYHNQTQSPLCKWEDSLCLPSIRSSLNSSCCIPRRCTTPRYRGGRCMDQPQSQLRLSPCQVGYQFDSTPRQQSIQTRWFRMHLHMQDNSAVAEERTKPALLRWFRRSSIRLLRTALSQRL